MVIVAPPATILSRLPDTIPDYGSKAKEEQEDDDDGVRIVFYAFSLVKACFAGFEFVEQGLTCRDNSFIDFILFHVLDNALLANVVTFYIGEIALQSLAGGDEIASVIDGEDNNQSTTFFFRTYTIAIAHVLGHAETVPVFHIAYNDEYCLYATIVVKLIEQAVGAH